MVGVAGCVDRTSSGAGCCLSSGCGSGTHAPVCTARLPCLVCAQAVLAQAQPRQCEESVSLGIVRVSVFDFIILRMPAAS
jgi:hypothetical protein